MDAIKGIYRKILNKELRISIYVWRNRLGKSIEGFFSFLINLFPCKFKVFIKEYINVKKLMDYSNARIYLDISSSVENNIRTKSCVKEPETIMWIEKFLKEGDVLWDIGANVGAYSLVAAKNGNGKVKVYSFEPSFLNFHQLCKNIALNNCGDVVTPFNLALSDKTVLEVFNYQNFVHGGALHNLGAAIDFKNEAFNPLFKQNMMSISVDDLIKTFNLSIPNHIKLDVDGIEQKILKGAKNTLNAPQLRSVLMEVGEEDGLSINLLMEAGFKEYDRYLQGNADHAMYNYIFVK